MTSQNQALDTIIEKLFQMAQLNAMKGEIPAACILLDSKSELGNPKWSDLASSSNQVRSKMDATAHAEILAIQKACQLRGSERLEGSVLISTLEPCCMCTGAIIHARIDTVYYVLPAQKGPGLRTLSGLTRQTPYHFNHYPRIEYLEKYAQRFHALLTGFFEKKR